MILNMNYVGNLIGLYFGRGHIILVVSNGLYFEQLKSIIYGEV
jgi:hypothetical protein